MLASNRAASEAALAHGVRCVTDVTGFGLLGHLREMAAASGLEAVVDAGRAPALPGALELAARGHAPGGAGRNRDFLTAWVDVDAAVPGPVRTLLVDPQTSGGLLLAAPPAQRDALLGALRAAGAGAYELGFLRDGAAGRIRVALGVRQPAG
jgi:selenide,water dikinase